MRLSHWPQTAVFFFLNYLQILFPFSLVYLKLKFLAFFILHIWTISHRYLKPKFAFLPTTINYFAKSDHYMILLISKIKFLSSWIGVMRETRKKYLKTLFSNCFFKNEEEEESSTYFTGDNPFANVPSRQTVEWYMKKHFRC